MTEISDYVVTKALIALDNLLPDNQRPIRLYVVGGYALQLNSVRTDPNAVTDVDYVGETFDIDVKRIIDRIGSEFGLGPGWLNNDLLLSGSTISELEQYTGPLSFVIRNLPGLKHITIYAADTLSVLRMKIIAIDTTLLNYLDNPTLGFTRLKDFNDIELACAQLGLDEGGLKKLVTEMDLEGLLLEPASTLNAIRREVFH